MQILIDPPLVSVVEGRDIQLDNALRHLSVWFVNRLDILRIHRIGSGNCGALSDMNSRRLCFCIGSEDRL